MPAPIEAAKPDQESLPVLVRGEGGGEQRRQRRHRAVHQSGKTRLHILQHEHAPAGLVFLAARTSGLRIVSVSSAATFSWPFSASARSPSRRRTPTSWVCSARLDVEALGLELHRLGFLADGVERQVLGQPDRAAAQKSLDVVPADRRQVAAETLFVHFQQHVAMVLFLLGHFLEQLGRVRIALGEVFGEAHVDAAVFLLGGDRYRQHFALGQIGEILHRGSSRMI